MQTFLTDRRVLLPVVLTAIVIAIGSVLIVVLSGNASGAGSPAAAAPAAAGTVTVEIADFKFAPEALTVELGTKVTWLNKDDAPHTATAKDGFDTGTLKKGESTTLALETAGSLAYVCTIHPFMTATVIVK